MKKNFLIITIIDIISLIFILCSPKIGMEMATNFISTNGGLDPVIFSSMVQEFSSSIRIIFVIIILISVYFGGKIYKKK